MSDSPNTSPAISKRPLIYDQSIGSYSALDDSKDSYDIKDDNNNNELKQLLVTYSCFEPTICDIILSFLPILSFNPFKYDKYSILDFILCLLNNFIHYIIVSIFFFIQNLNEKNFNNFINNFICPPTISNKSHCNLDSLMFEYIKWILLSISIIETLSVVTFYIYGFIKYRSHIMPQNKLDVININFVQTLHQIIDIFICLPFIIILFIVHNHILTTIFITSYFILIFYETMQFQIRNKTQNKYRANSFFSSYINLILLIIYGIQYESITITCITCSALFCNLFVIIWFNKFLNTITYVRTDVLLFVINIIIHYIICLLLFICPNSILNVNQCNIQSSRVKWIFLSFTIIESLILFIAFTIAGLHTLDLRDFNHDDHIIYFYVFHIIIDIITIPFIVLLFIINNEYIAIIFFVSYFIFSFYKTILFLFHGDDIIIHQFTYTFWNFILFIVYAIIFKSISLLILSCIAYILCIIVILSLSDFFVQNKYIKIDIIFFTINHTIHYIICFLIFLCPNSILSNSQCDIKSNTIKWWFLSFTLIESTFIFIASICLNKIASIVTNIIKRCYTTHIIIDITMNIPFIILLFIINNHYITIIFLIPYFLFTLYKSLLLQYYLKYITELAIPINQIPNQDIYGREISFCCSCLNLILF
eukprot:330723_1